MKIKKIKVILSLFIFILSAGLISACGQNPGKVVFKQSTLSMSLNQEISLDTLVELSGCSFDDVTFISSDPNVVYIKGGGRLVSRSEGVSIITAKGYADAILEVSVSGLDLKFETPSNISYDETKNAITWDAVYAGNYAVTTYQVKITKDNGAEEIKQVNTNSLEVLDAGNYKVSVSCKAREDVGIKESDYSSIYEFSKLSAPTNLEYNDQTGKLTWQSPDNNASFRVLVNGVASEIITTKEYSLNLKEPKKYDISVMVCASAGQDNVFGATSVDSLSLTRLSAPVLTIKEGVITWVDEEQGATAFDLTITGATTQNRKINKNSAGQYSENLPDKDPGEYAIEMFAIGDSSDLIYNSSEKYLNSDKVGISGIVKLQKQEISFDKLNKTINVVDFDADNGYKLMLTIKQNGVLKNVQDISLTGSFEYDFAESGVYEFVLSNLSKEDLQINADNSSTLTVVKLGQAANASHKIEGGKYFVEDYVVADATKYTIEVVQKDNAENRFELTSENNNVADLFGTSGEFVVNIYASGTDNEQSQIYYLDSVTNTKLSVIRLKDCELTDNKDEKAITWNSVASLGNLRYGYKLTGQDSDEGLLETNKFSYAGLGVGSYTLTVWATTSAVEGERTIILDSLTQKSIGFSIYKTILAPTLNWQKDATGGENKYYINISNVEGAKSYTVYLNGTAVGEVLASEDEFVLFDATSCFETKGAGENGNTYVFEVVATNDDNVYYNDSEKASITIVRANAPTTFAFSSIVSNETMEVQQTITSTTNDVWFNGCDVVINGVSTSNLSDEALGDVSIYNVKIKYIAKEEAQSGVYYIDSDYAEFVLNKITNSLDVEANKLTWANQETTLAFANRLIISQDDDIEFIDVTRAEEYNLNSINTSKFNFNSAISIALQTTIKPFNGEIAGEYVDGKFVSGEADGDERILSSYFIASNLNTINVQHITDAVGLEITEENSVVKISWNKETGATYKLNNKDITEFASETFEPTIKVYFSLEKATESGREVFLFNISRLTNVRAITIAENEQIAPKNMPSAASALVCKIGNDIVTDLAKVGTTETYLTAYYQAGETNGGNCYLNSDTTTFVFKRLTKLDTANNFNIYNDIISWNKEEAAAGNTYKYLVTFYDEPNKAGATPQEYQIELELSDAASLDLSQATYADIIYSLTGKKYIKVQKIVAGFDASYSQTNYLTSTESTVELKILNAPTDVVIKANEQDQTQNNITISWSINTLNGLTPSKYNVKIYNRHTEMVVSSIGYYTLSDLDTFFKSAGEWFVEVQAVGIKDVISSKYSQVVSITRLQPSTVLAVSSTGIITWSEVENAGSYVLSYSYTKAGELVNKNITLASSVNSYQIPQDELNEEFSGSIIAKLIALGTGVSSVNGGTLSSTKEAEFTRIAAPLITLQPTAMVFDNYADYVNGEKIYVTATIDSKQVLNLEVTPTLNASGKYSWTYPKTYQYYNGDKIETINFASAKSITFEVYATSEAKNVIDSNKVIASATILADVTNLNFARDNTGVIHFYATNPNAESASIQATIGSEIFEASGTLDVEFTEELLAKIGNSWTITVKALGKTGDVVYIESGVASISGTKLATVSGLTTSADNTKVVWNVVANATDYNLKYTRLLDDQQVIKSNYLSREEVIGTAYAADTYNFAVKPIGNVTTQSITSGIILDGTYCTSVAITKLDKIPNVKVQSGFFSLGEVANADAYVAVLYTSLAEASIGEYELTSFTVPTGEAGTFFYSEALMAQIADGKEYFVQFYAKTTKANFISSDFADVANQSGTDNYVIVRIFAKADNNITLSHPNIDANNVNYAITYATFNLNSSVNAGLLLMLNGQISLTAENTYLLDADGSWRTGNHTISYAQIGSSVIGADKKAYLTSFGESITVTKLANPTIYIGGEAGEIGEIFVAYTSVTNADMYYCYLADELKSVQTSAGKIDMSSLPAGLYSSLSVRAISKNINYLAGNQTYLTDLDSGINISIKKQSAPDKFDVLDGSFGFIPELLSELLPFYQGELIETPFLTGSFLMEYQYFQFRFKNKTTGVVTEFTDNVYKYLYITDSLINQIKTFMGEEVANVLKEAQTKGFPCLNYGFMDFAKTLTAGEYEISAKLIGNVALNEISEETGEVISVIALITSSYSQPITKYIGGAPEIRVENNDGTFNLKFTNVTVNSNYFSASALPTYNLVGIYTDETGKVVREVITSVTASGINNSEELVINLSELIQNDILTSKYTALYMYMAGNDDKGVLNGKCSNKISIIVLDAITASVEHGVIKWAAQDNATKYVVNYGQGTLEFKYQEGLAVYSWDCAELIEEQVYDITIMAYGSQGKTASAGNVLILSGKITDVGQIEKLSGISSITNGIDVQKGIYTWNAIANATAYDVFITAQEAGGEYGNYTTIPTNQFETTASSAVNYYYFRAVGTEYMALSESTKVFVNSNISAYNRGLRCAEVTNLQFTNGVLTWQHTNTNVSFKLVFNRVQSGTEEEIVIYTTYAECVNAGVCTLDTNAYESLKNFGDYIVKIQAFFESKTETNSASGTYYLISSAKELRFHKLETVTEIKVENGVISWVYNGRTNLDYHFRLHFSYYDEVSLKTIEEIKYVAAGVNRYEGVIFDDDISKYPITLVIYVVPGKIDVDTHIAYALSVPCTYQNEIHQFDRVNEDTIAISITANGQLLIDWYGPDDDGTGATSYKYEICYYTDVAKEERFISTSNSHVLCGDGQDISFDIDGEYSLYIKIRIIPIANDYISSAWTEPRQIEKPSKVTGLVYNEETYTFAWDSYETGDMLQSSFYYKVKDEIGYIDETTGNFVATTVYIFNANIGYETFTPFVIGVHRVSVAVIIKNSASSGLMSDYCDAIVANINMFESGDGTEENPYLIANETQFANIKHRLTKDTKNNSYYNTVITGGEIIVDEELTNVSENNTIYHFKQVAHLNIQKQHAIANYPDQNGQMTTFDMAFNGSYNGDYYSLTLVWNESIESNSAISYITIFEEIGEFGTIANVNVKLDLDSTITISKYLVISALAYQNKGNINNVVVGKDDSITEITIGGLRNALSLSFVAYQNYGTIQRVENYYSVNLTADNNIASIAYAPIAINNMEASVISMAKNKGNININAAVANIGGLVQYMANNSSLEQSAFVGNIHVFLKTSTTSNIGGLVGKATKAKITYSYAVGDITIAHSSSITPAAYVGGLVGSMEGDNITYAYANVTKNGSLIGGYVAYEGIYQVIGLLSSVGGNSKNVYYKQQPNFDAVQTTANISGSIISYNNYATEAGGLFETDSKFTDDALYNGNPTLKWEAAFEALVWKN